MSRRRYEILLPTRYNDGRPVEPEKLFQLKTRFRQIDIWMVSYEIEVV